MSSTLRERRRRRAFAFVVGAAALAAVAFVTVSIDIRSAQPEAAQGPVAPGLAQNLARAQRIIVTTAESAYRIERTDEGWAMRDRGDYPVNAGKLAQFTEGLANLALVRRMTSDPDRHGRLGVTDPRQGGSGVLLQIEDGQGALLANLVLGVEIGGLYVRKPDEDQVWSAAGELPPLRDAAAWLDLKPLAIAAETLSRVEIVPAEGRPYILQREAGATDDFAIVAPARLAPLTPSAVTAAAERLLRLTPIDVQPAPAIQGAPRARVRLRTFDGALIDAEFIPSGERIWLKLIAQAERPEAEAAVQAINAASAGWAYALSEADASAAAPPLAALLPPPPAPATPPSVAPRQLP